MQAFGSAQQCEAARAALREVARQAMKDEESKLSAEGLRKLRSTPESVTEPVFMRLAAPNAVRRSLSEP